MSDRSNELTVWVLNSEVVGFLINYAIKKGFKVPEDVNLNIRNNLHFDYSDSKIRFWGNYRTIELLKASCQDQGVLCLDALTELGQILQWLDSKRVEKLIKDFKCLFFPNGNIKVNCTELDSKTVDEIIKVRSEVMKR